MCCDIEKAKDCLPADKPDLSLFAAFKLSLDLILMRPSLFANQHGQGRIQEFWKGGPVRGAKPRTERRRRERRRGVWGPPPENFEKLDAIFCNLAYILGSEWPQISFKIGPLQNKKQ